jgi:hypothetical protein
MEINERLAQLGRQLDEWFDGSGGTFASNDRTAQGKAIFRGIELIKEIDRIKAKGLAALKALLKPAGIATNQDGVASLVGGFRFGARLAHALHDELLDTTGETKVVCLMDAIVHQLGGIDPGRAVLLPLLADPDAGVRAYAGAYLIKLIPDRVIPILHDIEEKEDANSAHFTAYWALLIWEREGKHAATNK